MKNYSDVKRAVAQATSKQELCQLVEKVDALYLADAPVNLIEMADADWLDFTLQIRNKYDALDKQQQVFVVPGTLGIIDYAVMRAGVLVGQITNETIEQLALRYPGVVVSNLDDAIEAHENAMKTNPVEITEEQFIEMLGCLPPMGWVNRGNAESFKMSERTSGKITGIYVRIGKKFYHMSDVFSLKHDEIIAKVEQFFPKLH